jgi:hypothetical protein
MICSSYKQLEIGKVYNKPGDDTALTDHDGNDHEGLPFLVLRVASAAEYLEYHRGLPNYWAYEECARRRQHFYEISID